MLKTYLTQFENRKSAKISKFTINERLIEFSCLFVLRINITVNNFQSCEEELTMSLQSVIDKERQL